MNNWSDWQNDMNSLRDLGQLVLLALHSKKQKYWDKDLVIFCWMRSPSLVLRTSSSAIFNQLSNPGLECQGFVFTLAVIMAAPSVFLLAQHKPHPHNKCKVLVVGVLHSERHGCVHGGREGVEGVEYLPWGYGKEITERQWSTEQPQTSQDRTGRRGKVKKCNYFENIL